MNSSSEKITKENSKSKGKIVRITDPLKLLVTTRLEIVLDPCFGQHIHIIHLRHLVPKYIKVVYKHYGSVLKIYQQIL